MDGIDELASRLASWAAGSDVRIKRTSGLLRLENPDGTANAVVTFPNGFWETYEAATEERRNQAMHSMVLRVQVLYPPIWRSQEALDIAIPITFVQEV